MTPESELALKVREAMGTDDCEQEHLDALSELVTRAKCPGLEAAMDGWEAARLLADRQQARAEAAEARLAREQQAADAESEDLTLRYQKAEARLAELQQEQEHPFDRSEFAALNARLATLTAALEREEQRARSEYEAKRESYYEGRMDACGELLAALHEREKA